jgi:peptidyl-prolyl cis-trans isomerase C
MLFTAQVLFALIVLFFQLSVVEMFAIRPHSLLKTTTSTYTQSTSYASQSLKMGLFDFLKPKKSASASHILVKGNNGQIFLTDLKEKLNKSKDIPRAFAEAATQYSACPSSQRGGSLGNFQQGQMVPAFDKVVFNEPVNVIHGPIATPFGYHLILIDKRDD